MHAACLVLTSLLCAGCTSLDVVTQAGYSSLTVGGDVSLAADDGSLRGAQAVGSAFGLGSERGAPFVRGAVDVGWLAAAAAFTRLQESGTGRLQGDFGGLPASTPVQADLELGLTKLTATVPFAFGPLRLAPGLQLDVLDLEFTAQETATGNREEIDDALFLPLLHVRGELTLGPVCIGLDLGALDTPTIDDASATVLDVELLVEWSVLAQGHVFAGYRHLEFDAAGTSGDDRLAVDLDLTGWTLGFGLRF